MCKNRCRAHTKKWKDIRAEMQLSLHFPIKFSKAISKFYIIIYYDLQFIICLGFKNTYKPLWMFKLLYKPGFSSTWAVNFQMFKLDLEKAEIKLQHLLDHRKSKRVPEKTFTSALLAIPKPLTMWTTINCGTFFKIREYQTIWPSFWEICMQVKKQQLDLDMEHQTGSKWGKESIKAVYCHSAYLTYTQSHIMQNVGLVEEQARTSWNQDIWEKYQ